MFRRRAKIEDEQPKPPTKAEMLEDLQTCSIESLIEVNSYRNSDPSKRFADTSLSSAESTKTNQQESDDEHEFNEWWGTFKKFIDDVDKLEAYKKQFAEKRKKLDELDQTIKHVVDDIEQKMMESIQRVRDELDDDPIDIE